MAKAEHYYVSVKKTSSGAMKIWNRKVSKGRGACICWDVGDMIVRLAPYIVIGVIGVMIVRHLAKTSEPPKVEFKNVLEVREGTNVVFSISRSAKEL